MLGTGSSAIQIIPEIAKLANHLFVFQRTANYVVPANNRPLDPDEVAHIKANYNALRNKAKHTYSGNIFQSGGESALAVSANKRQIEYESRWEYVELFNGISFAIQEGLYNANLKDSNVPFLEIYDDC